MSVTDQNDFVDDFISDYEDSTKKSTGLSGEEKLKKNFHPQNSIENIRLLKQVDVVKNSKTYGKNVTMQTAHFHVLKVGKEYKKIYCPKHNDGEQCALCDKYERILLTQKKGYNLSEADKASNKEIFKKATEYQAKLFYIFKIADLGDIKNGAKFWRFKHSFKKDGVMDLLVGTGKKYTRDNYIEGNYRSKDMADSEFGCDLEVNVVDKENNFNKKTYKAVNQIFATKPKPINENIAHLVSDKLTWRDLWKATELGSKNGVIVSKQQYLQLCAEGCVPIYDKTEKRWFVANHPEIEEKLNNRNSNVVDEDVDEEEASAEKPTQLPNAVDFDTLSASIAANTTVITGIEEKYQKQATSKQTIFDESEFGDLDDLPF